MVFCPVYIQALCCVLQNKAQSSAQHLEEVYSRFSLEVIKLKIVLPIPPSINAAYVNNRGAGKGRMLSKAAENWKFMAGIVAKQKAHKEGFTMAKPEEKIVLELNAFWPDRRRRDMNNLHKLLCDAFECILYPDDKMVLVRDIDFAIDKKAPRVECEIYVKE